MEDKQGVPVQNEPGYEVFQESIFSLAMKILLLQLLVALTSVVVVVVLAYFFPAAGGSNLLLPSVVLMNIILQTIDAAILIYLVYNPLVNSTVELPNVSNPWFYATLLQRGNK